VITVIAARSRNRVIGIDDSLPWHLSSDLKRFKDLTMGHTVIMGRKTFESIGHALPNRHNIVITSDIHLDFEGIQLADTFQRAILLANLNKTEIFVIGGERIYESALNSPLVDAIELTLVNTRVENGDAFFPVTLPEHWTLVNEEVFCKDENNDYDYAFLRYERTHEWSRSGPLLYLPAARFDDQAGHMEEILNDGICPFCQQWLGWYHKNPTELETEHWIVTKNDNPYVGTLNDLLLIPKAHTENFLQLSEDEQIDFSVVIAETMRHFNLGHCALGMRSGDMSRTGGSVAHLHAHIKVGDTDNPDHQPIRFKMSSVPKQNKAPTSLH